MLTISHILHQHPIVAKINMYIWVKKKMTLEIQGPKDQFQRQK